MLNLIGMIHFPKIPVVSMYFKDKPLPVFDKKVLAAADYDAVIVSGDGADLAEVLEEVQGLNVDADKFILDRTICVPDFSLEIYRKLRRSKLSIISMNNWNLLLGQTLGLNFGNVNVRFDERTFLKFLRDLPRYLKIELRLYKKSPHMTFTLGDIKFRINGCVEEDAARSAWEDWRLNLNLFNLLVVMYTENPEILAEFDALPFAKKICFVPFETKTDSGFQIKPFYVGGREFELSVNKIAAGEISCFELWDMLLYSKETPINLYSKSNTPTLKPGCHYSTSDNQIQFFNWYPTNMDLGNHWMSKFIKNEIGNSKVFNIFSVYGDCRFVKLSKVNNKIFWANEDVFTWPWYEGYQDYCLDCVDLAIGCEFFNAKNFLRVPIGFFGKFEPKLDINLIREKIAEFNNSRSTRKYDCVLICRHDMMNTRAPIYEGLKNVLQIKCAGKWNRNTDELQTVYGDDKAKYVHEFIFNICPENVNRFGYVTEKIFDAFLAGAIPIYSGSDNNPEPGIINKDAVLFWRPNENNDDVVKEVIRLKNDENYYEKFMSQEKIFAREAADYIYSTLETLARKLKEIS